MVFFLDSPNLAVLIFCYSIHLMFLLIKQSELFHTNPSHFAFRPQVCSNFVRGGAVGFFFFFGNQFSDLMIRRDLEILELRGLVELME